jgi:hypothetical protein
MATVQFVTAKNGLEIVVNIRLYFASHIPGTPVPMSTTYSYGQVAELLNHVTSVVLGSALKP